MSKYQSTEDYIRSEYRGAVEDALVIIDGHLGTKYMIEHVERAMREALALHIAGYFTGCLTVAGEPRVVRGRDSRRGLK
jgi:creatinine amidohydrolase/Fe(II)-dependent formamide hydrolase-like protein